MSKVREEKQDAYLRDLMNRRFGEAHRVISTVRLESMGEQGIIDDFEHWGLLLFSSQNELVFNHFDEDGWIEALKQTRRVKQDRVLCFPIDEVEIDYVEKPGFINKLLGSDVGNIGLSVGRAVDRLYEEDRIVREDTPSGPMRFMCNVDSVSHALEILTSRIPLQERNGSE